MSTFVLTLGAIAFIMSLMAIGVLFNGKALKGSCGGVGAECPCADEAEENGEEFVPGSACENPASPS